MDRRQFVSGLALLASSLCSRVALGETAQACPLCGGKVVDAQTLVDDSARRSRNLTAWSRAADCLARPDASGPICTQCWYMKLGGAWVKSSERSDDFYRPLSRAIAGFPMPHRNRIQGRVIYEQRLEPPLGQGELNESLSFWCRKPRAYVARIQAYASANALQLETEEPASEPGAIYLRVGFSATQIPHARDRLHRVGVYRGAAYLSHST
ncbi:hypothetical protein [Lysobacter capsici]|uniref:hypothetical protein n=1 Tax=Lysobacter capsici TaxID=435897 RepID=UPI001C007037|nr:hypothetical protein [Lysobacter capsici]QWF16367.1 hypothetical protein KME82_21840 [Lysobacter capsici]